MFGMEGEESRGASDRNMLKFSVFRPHFTLLSPHLLPSEHRVAYFKMIMNGRVEDGK